VGETFPHVWGVLSPDDLCRDAEGGLAPLVEARSKPHG